MLHSGSFLQTVCWPTPRVVDQRYVPGRGAAEQSRLAIFCPAVSALAYVMLCVNCVCQESGIECARFVVIDTGCVSKSICRVCNRSVCNWDFTGRVLGTS